MTNKTLKVFIWFPTSMSFDILVIPKKSFHSVVERKHIKTFKDPNVQMSFYEKNNNNGHM